MFSQRSLVVEIHTTKSNLKVGNVRTWVWTLNCITVISVYLNYQFIIHSIFIKPFNNLYFFVLHYCRSLQIDGNLLVCNGWKCRSRKGV
jgi:hypothetical protein